MKDSMRHLVVVLFIMPFLLTGQEKNTDEKPVEPPKIKLAEKQILRKGNDLYKEKRFVDAEVKYKKALQKNQYYETAGFNLGNAVYEQKRYEEALPQYEMVSKSSRDLDTRSNAFHNAGNVNMKQKQYDKAIDNFKKSLLLDPNDEETRYNLALAQKLLEDQQNQNDENKDQNQDQNQDQQQDQDQNQNNENKDQNQDQGDNKDKDKEQDQGDNKSDPKDDNNQGDQEKKNQQPEPNQLSDQQIEQLLEAMNNEENKTQQKVNAKKARGKKVNQEKDW